MSSTYNFSTYNFESPKDFTMPVRMYQTLSKNIVIPVSVKIRFYPEKAFFLGIGGNENDNSIVDVLFNFNNMGFHSSNISYSRVEYPICNSYRVLMDGVEYNFDYCIGLNLLQMLDLFRSDEINLHNNCALFTFDFFDIPNDCYIELLGNDLNTVLSSSKFIYDDILKNQNNALLQSLIDKLDTLDNLNILSQADFTPLLNLSSLSDTLALLNPTITIQNQVTSELNSNVEQLLPVRAKYGEPVTPVSPTTVILSLQGRHKLEITRKSDVNSILTLFEKDGNILGYFFDIDYSRYKNLENYNQLYLSYDSADYDINLLPIIGYDD